MRNRNIKKEYRLPENDFFLLEKLYKDSKYNKTDYIINLMYLSLQKTTTFSTDFIKDYRNNITRLYEKEKKYNDKEYIENLYSILIDIEIEINKFLNFCDLYKLSKTKISKQQKRLSFNLNTQENNCLIKLTYFYKYKNESEFFKALINNNVYNQEIFFEYIDAVNFSINKINIILKRLNFFSYLSYTEKLFFLNYGSALKLKLRRI